MRFAAVFLLAALFFAARPVPHTIYYVDIPLQGRSQIKDLVAQGFDIGGINLEENTLSLIVNKTDLGKTRNLNVLRQTKIRPAPDSEYQTPEEVEKKLFELEKLYPELIQISVIGKSLDGREIYAAEVTHQFVIPSSGSKPTVLFDAMHHAREVMTTEVALDIIETLAKNYDQDAEVQKWLNNYSIWVVPMMNPDGNHNVWSVYPMWRKNNRNEMGVDNNRNYPFEWGKCNGSSTSISSDQYRGSAPASEPETKALMDLATKIKPKFNISYHSYSEIVIYPYGCSPKKVPSPDQEVYYKVGRELAKKLVRDSGKGSYTAGTSYELLYNVDGGSVDWMYESLGTISLVIEMNSSTQGFQPDYGTWRDKTLEKQRVGWKYILDQMDKVSLP